MEDFESDSNPDPTFWNQWKLEGSTNAPNVIPDPTDGGNQVMECNISRPASPYGSSNSRSEPTRREGTADIPEWLPYGFEGSYQYRFYIPSEFDWDPNGSSHEVTMTQFKPPRGVTIGKPNVTFRIDNRHLNMIVRYETNETKVRNNKFTTVSYNGDGLITLKKGRWYYVVIDYSIHHNSTGMIKYYIKEGSFPSASDLMFSHSGGMCYNSTFSGTEGVYLKFGLYLWHWRNQGGIEQDDPISGNYLGTDVDRFRLLFDDVKLQDHHEFTPNHNPAPNQAPIVDAGHSQNITLPDNTVTLSGIASDADGNIASYLWTQQSGPGNAAITGIEGPSLEASDLIAGSYSFRLTVTDNDGAGAYDDVSLTVDSAFNQAPIVDAGPSQIITLPDNTVTLSGTASDVDGNIATYLWTQQSGPGNATLTGIDGPSLEASDLIAGSYSFRLTVTDNEGAAAYDEVSVIVDPVDQDPAQNQAPMAHAGPSQTITLPDNTVTLNGTASDADGNIDSYLWTQQSGPGNATLTGIDGPSLEASDLIAGSYSFRLTVTDDDGGSAYDEVSVTVDLAPITVTAAVKDANCDADNGAIDLTIFGGSGSFNFNWSNGKTSEDIDKITSGDYQVTIIDQHGVALTKSFSVYSEQSNITLIAEVDDASCSKQDGAIQVTVQGGTAPYTYEWSNGSNQTNIKRVPAGEYKVKVTDKYGCSKKFNLEVPVEPGETEFELVSQLKLVSCNGEDGDISLSVIGDSGPYNYTWSHGSTDPNRSGLQFGTYHVLITDRHGCFMNAEYDIYPNSILTPTIIQSGDSLYTDAQAENYQWYKEGMVLEGATQNTLIINETGSYMVQVSEGNCNALSDPHEVEEILATNTNFTIQQVEIFPNPVVNHLSTRIYLNETAEIRLTLYDFQGTELWSQDLESISSYTASKIDVSNYSPGIYFIKIAAGQEVLTRKIIKR